MSRETYVFRAGAVVHKEFAPALHASNSAPNVIRDVALILLRVA